jgi:hypothetical protein
VVQGGGTCTSVVAFHGCAGDRDSQDGWMRWVGRYVGLCLIVIVMVGFLDVCLRFAPLMQAIRSHAHALLPLKSVLRFIFTRVSSPSWLSL